MQLRNFIARAVSCCCCPCWWKMVSNHGVVDSIHLVHPALLEKLPLFLKSGAERSYLAGIAALQHVSNFCRSFVWKLVCYWNIMRLAEQLPPWVDVFQCVCSILCIVWWFFGPTYLEIYWLQQLETPWVHRGKHLRVCIYKVFVMHSRANGWIGYLFTTSNICLQTSDSPMFYEGFSKCWTKTCRGIESREFSFPIDEWIKCWASFQISGSVDKSFTVYSFVKGLSFSTF